MRLVTFPHPLILSPQALVYRQKSQSKIFSLPACPLQLTLSCETIWSHKTKSKSSLELLCFCTCHFYGQIINATWDLKTKVIVAKIFAGCGSFPAAFALCPRTQQQRLLLSWNSHSQTCLRCFNSNTEEELLMWFLISRASGLCCVCLAINRERDTLYEAGILRLKTPPLLTILLLHFDLNATSNPPNTDTNPPNTDTNVLQCKGALCLTSASSCSADVLDGNKEQDFDMQISPIIKI